MATFTPPLRDGNSMVGARGEPLNRLMRFYGSWAQGVTIWRDSSDVWHESLEPYQGGATHTTIDAATGVHVTSPPDEGLATAEVVYLGGHVYNITESAADDLVAAGYGSSLITRESILETFTGPDSQPPGPDLDWTSEVFTDQPYNALTFNDQLWFHTDAPGAWEQILVPTPNVDSPDATGSIPIDGITLTGTGDHQVGVGPICRYEPHSGGTYYRGYAFEVSRSNIIFPGVDLWCLIIWRIRNSNDITVLAIDTEPFAQVTLPGTFTFTADGPNLSASFTHGGAAPTMTAATTDSTYSDGKTVLGFGHVQSGTEVATTVINSFQVGPA